MSEALEPCPACGALPCDWVDNPHTPKPADSQLVELITKAVLFEDCGSTEDWKDNLNIGEAVLAALSQHQSPADAELDRAKARGLVADLLEHSLSHYGLVRDKVHGVGLVQATALAFLASGAHREVGE